MAVIKTFMIYLLGYRKQQNKTLKLGCQFIHIAASITNI